MFFRIFQESLPKTAILPEEEKRYLTNVLRLNKGESFEIVDGKGSVGIYVIEEIGKYDLQAKQERIYNEDADPPRKLVLVQPLLKADKLEMVLQKSTELGVHEILLYQSELSPVRLPGNDKMFRWKKIIQSAVCQSRRSHCPALYTYKDLSELMDTCTLTNFYYADFVAGASELGSLAEKLLTIAVGSESGFSTAEKELLAKKAKPINLGRTVLRAETASLAVCARVLI